MELSTDCLKSLCGIGVAAGAFALGLGGIPVLAGAAELLTGSGELALNFKDGKRDAFSAIEKKVQKSITKNYREWIKADGDAKSDRNLSINAALAQLDDAILLAKPTLKDMVDNRLNGENFVATLFDRLPETNLFKQDKIAEQVFRKMLIGVHGLVRGDVGLKPVFDNLVFEEVFVEFDEAQKDRDSKHAETLEKHQQQIDAIHSKMGIPVEKLTALFVAAEHEFPDGNYLEAVERAIDNLISKGSKSVDFLNSGDAIVGVIEAARALMKKADAEGAVRLLREERLANMRGNARLAMEEADVLAMTYKWDEAILAWRDAAMLDPDDAWAWYFIGDTHEKRGDLGEALKFYRRGENTAKRAGNSRDLAAGYDRIGDVLIATGDVEGALVAFNDSLAISQRLSDSDKTNAVWQRDLSVSHNKIGDVLIAKGDVDGALVAYENSLAIVQRLSGSDKTNARWQRDISVSHEKIGNVLIAKGDVEGALVAFKDGLTIRRRLSDSDKTNAGWQRDLIVSNVKLAGLGDQSLMRYRAALKIVLELRDSGRLQPVDEWLVAELEKLLAQAEG